MIEHVECNNCGLCCHIPTDKGVIGKPCKNLRYKDGKSYCIKYDTRLGTFIGVAIFNGKRIPFFCGMRKQSKFDYPDCPGNVGNPVLVRK